MTGQMHGLQNRVCKTEEDQRKPRKKLWKRLLDASNTRKTLTTANGGNYRKIRQDTHQQI